MPGLVLLQAMAAAAWVPYPLEPEDGLVRDLRAAPADHVWQWMRRLQAQVCINSSHQVRDTEKITRMLRDGENVDELAGRVANRAESLKFSIGLLDDVLMELDRRFGHQTPRARR